MTLEELNIKFTATTSGLQSQLNSINGQLGGLQNSAGKTQSAFGGMGKMIAAGATAAIVTGLFSIGKEALSMANDAVESDNLFEVSMGGMSASARAWSESLSKSLGLNAYEVRKNVGTLNTMFGSMGIGEQAAYDMSTGLTQLASDMASFYNLSTEEAFQKLQSGITGEAEPLKRLGILVNENTVAQYAYKNGIAKSGAALNDQQKVMARYGTIMEQTKLAQGDLARTMDSPTNQIRKMNAQLDQAKIALGQALQPALLAILPVFTGLAVGATRVIQALTGSDAGGASVFQGVAMTVEEATKIAQSSIGTQTDALVTEINTKRTAVEEALTAYAQAVTATKSVELELDLKESSTTEERVTEGINTLHAKITELAGSFTTSVTAYLDALFEAGEIDETELNDRKADLKTKTDNIIAMGDALEIKVNAKIDAALVDGTVTKDEQSDIDTTLQTGAQEIIDAALADLKAYVKQVRLDLQHGKITVEEAETAVGDATDAVQGAIGEVTGVVVDVSAEIGVVDWKAESISIKDKIKLSNAIEAEIAAGEKVMVEASVYVNTLFAGTGNVAQLVTDVFGAANSAATAAGEALQGYVTSALENGTEIDFATLNKLRENYYEAMKYITSGLTPGGEFNKALFNLDLSPESMSTLTSAFASSTAQTTEGQNALRDERLNWLFNASTMPNFDKYLADNGFASLQDAVMQINKMADDAIRQNSSDMVLRAKEALAPQFTTEKLNTMSEKDARDIAISLQDMLDSMDYTTLSEDAKAAYDELAKLQNDMQLWADYLFQKSEYPTADIPTPPLTTPTQTPAQQQESVWQKPVSAMQDALSSAAEALSSVQSMAVDAGTVTINAPYNSVPGGTGGIDRFNTEQTVNVQIEPQPVNVSLSMDGYLFGKAVAIAVQKVAKASGSGGYGKQGG